MKSPIILLQLESNLSEDDKKSIREALDQAYELGYAAGTRSPLPPSTPRYDQFIHSPYTTPHTINVSNGSAGS